MTMKTIRTIYKVPAYKGVEVVITKSDGVIQRGVIIGYAREQFLKVKLEDYSIRLCHPTRCEYVLDDLHFAYL